LKILSSFHHSYECQFIDDQNSYVPLSLVEPLMKLYENEENGQNLWLGIDVGRHRDVTDITAIGEDKKGKKEVRIFKSVLQVFNEFF